MKKIKSIRDKIKLITNWIRDKIKLITNWIRDKIKLITNWIRDKIKFFWSALWPLVVVVIIYSVIQKKNLADNKLCLILLWLSIPFAYFNIISGFNKLIKKENILSKSIRLSYMFFGYILCALVSLISCTGLIKGILKPNKTDKVIAIMTNQFALTLCTMIMLYCECFFYCLKMLKKELNCKYALFISYSIKSLLLALASSLAIIAALSYLDIEKNYSIIYKNISIVVTMLYPTFDVYEYTYKKVDEYEKNHCK